MADNTAWDTSSLFVEGIPPGAKYLRYSVTAAMKAGLGGYSVASDMVSPSLTEQIIKLVVPRAAFHHVSTRVGMLVREDPDVEASVSRQGPAVADLQWNVAEDLAQFEYLSEVDRSVPGRPAVTFGTASTGHLGDYTEVKLTWGSTRWTAYLPGMRRSTVQLPELPPGFDRFAPLAQDDVYLDVGARMVDDLAIDGYTGFVSQPYEPSENVDWTDVR